MSRGGLLVLIALLAAAIAAVVWLGRTTAPQETAEPAEALVKAFAVDAVHDIDLACADAAVTLVREGSRGWNITKPFDAEADLRRVDALIASLHDARVKKVIAAEGAHLQAFGLAPAACTVHLGFAPAAPAVTLRLGRASPVGSERYATVDDSRVVLTDGNVYGVVASGADTFREKRLFPLEPDAVTRIAVDRPDGRIVLSSSGGAWRIESPSPDAAASSACEGLARALAAVEFAGPDAVPVPTAVQPARLLRLEVATGDKEPAMVAFVAAAGINGKRVGWRAGAKRAGLIDESALGELLRAPESFRDRRIVSFSTPDVRRVTVDRGGTPVLIARAGEASPWTGSEGAVNFPVDGHRVDELLDRLRGLTASGFAPDLPKSKAKGSLVIEGQAGVLARVTWGALERPKDAGGEEVWLTTPARPGIVFRMEAANFGLIPEERSDWTQPSNPPAQPAGGS